MNSVPRWHPMAPDVIGCLTGRFQLAWLHVLYLLIGNPPLLWGRKLQCSLLHLNKYIKNEREEELGFHSNWHLSNSGDELEGIRLENDIFASWRVRIDPVSYPITERAVVQARAIQHESASQTTTGCRTSPQTSQEVDLMNTCPPTPLLYHLSIHF